MVSNLGRFDIDEKMTKARTNKWRQVKIAVLNWIWIRLEKIWEMCGKMTVTLSGTIGFTTS